MGRLSPRSEKESEELAREITRKTELWLDDGYGECVFKDTILANEMSKSMLHIQDQRYQCSCFTVMHDHVHLVIKPLANFQLQDILESIKGFISRKVNSHLGRSDTLWEQESYDRIIRDEQHLYRVVQYIGCNPANAGYLRDTWVRWIHSDWDAAGWGFRK